MEGARRRGQELGVVIEDIDESLLRDLSVEEKVDLEKLKGKISQLKASGIESVEEIKLQQEQYLEDNKGKYNKYLKLKEQLKDSKGLSLPVSDQVIVNEIDTAFKRFQTDIDKKKAEYEKLVAEKKKQRSHLKELYLARRLEEYLDKVERNRRRVSLVTSQSGTISTSVVTHVAQLHPVPATIQSQVTPVPSPSQLSAGQEEIEAEETGLKYTYQSGSLESGNPSRIGEELSGLSLVTPASSLGSKPPQGITQEESVGTPISSVIGVAAGKTEEELRAEVKQEALVREYTEELQKLGPGLEDKGLYIFEKYSGYITTGLTQSEFNTLATEWTEYITLYQVYESCRLKLSRLVRQIPQQVVKRQEPDWYLLEELLNAQETEKPVVDPKAKAAMDRAKLRKQIASAMSHVTKFSGSPGEDPQGHVQSFQLHFRLVTEVDILGWEHEGLTVHIGDVIDYFQSTLCRYAKQWFQSKYGNLTPEQKTVDKWKEIYNDFITSYNIFGKTDMEREKKLREISWDPNTEAWEDFLLHFRSLMCGADKTAIPASRQLTCFILAMPKTLLNLIMNQTKVEEAIEVVSNAVSMGYLECRPMTAQKAEPKPVEDSKAGAAAVPFMSASSVNFQPGRNQQDSTKGVKKQMQTLENKLMQKLEEVMYVGQSNNQGGQGQRPWRGGGGGQGYNNRGRRGGFQGNQQQRGNYWGRGQGSWDNQDNWGNPRDRNGWRNNWRGPPRGRGRGGPPRSQGDATDGGQQNNKVQCFYCKKFGHIVRDCNMLRYRSSQEQQGAQSNPQSQRGSGQNRGQGSDQSRGVNDDSNVKIDRKDLAAALADIMKSKKDGLN